MSGERPRGDRRRAAGSTWSGSAARACPRSPRCSWHAGWRCPARDAGSGRARARSGPPASTRTGATTRRWSTAPARVVVSSAIRATNPEARPGARAGRAGAAPLRRAGEPDGGATRGRGGRRARQDHDVGDGRRRAGARRAGPVLGDRRHGPPRGRGRADPVGGAHAGSGDVMVVEADESDGSFLAYRPEIAVVTNVEPDHLDHYGSREAFEQAFVDFAGRVTGTLVRVRGRPRRASGWRDRRWPAARGCCATGRARTSTCGVGRWAPRGRRRRPRVTEPGRTGGARSAWRCRVRTTR